MKLCYYPESEILVKATKPVEKFDSELRDIAADMLLLMYNNDGVGLAANQVGLDMSLFVVATCGHQYAVANPQIHWGSKMMEDAQEGCLSLPGLYGNVSRHRSITVSYYDMSGMKRDVLLSNHEARVFQHEYDHLQGIMFPFRKMPTLLSGAKPLIVKPWEFSKIALIESI